MAEKDTTLGVVGGAAAAALAPHASRRLLGYHVIQHGTTHQTAAKIKRKGFDPKRGGTGGAGEHAGGSEERKARFKRNSAGKIHVTKNPIMSRAFAGMTQSRKANPTAVDLLKGKVLKARVSHRHWEGMHPDADMNGQKWVAATTHHKIPAHQVIGGKGDKGIRGVVNKNTLRQYYANKANHGRIARGAAMAAGVAGGTYHAAKAVKKKFEKKASLSSLARTYLEVR